LSEKKDIEEKIYEIIMKKLRPVVFNIVNNSHKHKNHLLKNESQSHFFLNIVSDVFRNQSMVQRHKLVYKLLSDVLSTKVHSLQMGTYTSEEYKKSLRNGK